MRGLQHRRPCAAQADAACRPHALHLKQQSLADTVLCGLQVLQFDSQLSKLPVGCLLAAAFMTYLAAEPEDARESALAEWHRIVGWTPGSFNFVLFLSTESETLTWKTEGQPESRAYAASWALQAATAHVVCCSACGGWALEWALVSVRVHLRPCLAACMVQHQPNFLMLVAWQKKAAAV